MNSPITLITAGIAALLVGALWAYSSAARTVNNTFTGEVIHHPGWAGVVLGSLVALVGVALLATGTISAGVRNART